MKKILTALVATISLSLTVACSDKDDSYLVNSERFQQLTPEEQNDLAPTQLFRSVYTNDIQTFKSQLDTAGFLDFKKKNKADETALSTAIKLRRTEIINLLVNKATFEDLTTPNRDGRSYVSLLAEYNYEEAFDIIGQKYILQIRPMGNIMANFNEIDFGDNQGKRAAHYAQTASFLDKLEQFWFYGFLDFSHPWDQFYNYRDMFGNTFLHTAAEYGKSDILAWYVQRHCGVFGIEHEDYWWILRTAGFIIRKGGEYIQDSKWMPIRYKFINTQNVDGNTPLHLAAKNGNSRTIEAILQCHHTDPTMLNLKEQSPVTYLLKNLDPDQKEVDKNFKDSLLLLVDQVDPLWSFMPFMTFKNMVNAQDVDGFSAIHYAARMRDPFFYKTLAPYQLPTTDGQGIIPQDRHRN